MKVPAIGGVSAVGMVTVRDLAESLGDSEEIVADEDIVRRRQNHPNHPENTCGRNREG